MWTHVGAGVLRGNPRLFEERWFTHPTCEDRRSFNLPANSYSGPQGVWEQVVFSEWKHHYHRWKVSGWATASPKPYLPRVSLSAFYDNLYHGVHLRSRALNVFLPLPIFRLTKWRKCRMFMIKNTHENESGLDTLINIKNITVSGLKLRLMAIG